MSAIPCASVNLKTMADGTLRISFDIEPANAQDAFRLFAAPGTPAAIAALSVGYASVEPIVTKQASEPEPVETKQKGGVLAKLAGMWCADPEFLRWAGCAGPTDAKRFMQDACEIVSRVELDHDQIAAEKFHKHIRGPYSRHLIARGITA